MVEMNDLNKKKALKILETIECEGSTNILKAFQIAFQLLSSLNFN